MNTIEDLVESAACLVDFARRSSVSVQPGDVKELLKARGNRAILQLGDVQETFVASFDSVVVAMGSEKYSIFLRSRRIAPLLANAQSLLGFAVANGRKIEDETRSSIVAAQSAADNCTLSDENERSFLKAYEELSIALSPITAETLVVSKTVMPGWRPQSWLQSWSFGRFFNVLVFIVALIGTCMTLSYYAQGAASLKRFNELKEVIAKAGKELPEKKVVLVTRAKALEEVTAKAPRDPKEVETATRAAADAEREWSRALSDESDAINERAAIPFRLELWASQPCGESSNWFMALLCSRTMPSEVPQKRADDGQFLRVESARTVATRLSDVYLPLLLGWLGAHAFILRNMSKAITERSFAPGSAFNHIVRLGLGALAGLASNWLLTPAAVGGAQWNNLPVWALAFVAGYGIELVFAFMDRIIGAFTTKQ